MSTEHLGDIPDDEFYERVGTQDQAKGSGCKNTILVGYVIECPVHGRITLHYRPTEHPLHTACPHDPEPSPDIQVNTAITAG
jgi:hypothetical protein